MKNSDRLRLLRLANTPCAKHPKFNRTDIAPPKNCAECRDRIAALKELNRG